jgi:hypothetical protein
MTILFLALCAGFFTDRCFGQVVTSQNDYIRLDSLLFVDSTLIRPLPATHPFFKHAKGRLAYDITVDTEDIVDVFVDQVPSVWAIDSKADSISISDLINRDRSFSKEFSCFVKLGIDWTGVIWKATLSAYKGRGLERLRLKSLLKNLRAAPAMLRGAPIATTCVVKLSKQ